VATGDKSKSPAPCSRRADRKQDLQAMQKKIGVVQHGLADHVPRMLRPKPDMCTGLQLVCLAQGTLPWIVISSPIFMEQRQARHQNECLL
jgi:hypothetical protein